MERLEVKEIQRARPKCKILNWNCDDGDDELNSSNITFTTLNIKKQQAIEKNQIDSIDNGMRRRVLNSRSSGKRTICKLTSKKDPIDDIKDSNCSNIRELNSRREAFKAEMNKMEKDKYESGRLDGACYEYLNVHKDGDWSSGKNIPTNIKKIERVKSKKMAEVLDGDDDFYLVKDNEGQVVSIDHMPVNDRVTAASREMNVDNVLSIRENHKRNVGSKEDEINKVLPEFGTTYSKSDIDYDFKKYRASYQ